MDNGPKARTWGPFTGKQLTAMAITLIVMVLFPVSAFAVTGSNVFVADAATGKHASVDTTGNLHVKALSAPTIVKNFFVKSYSMSGANTAIVTPPAGKALVITSIQADVFALGTPGSGTALEFFTSTGNTTCGINSGSFVQNLAPSSLGMQVLPYEPGVVVSPNRSLCGFKVGTISADIIILGYWIAAADAPAGQ